MFFKVADVSMCDECGARDWTEPSFWSRLGSWLNLGGPWRAAGPRTCRRCGNQILGFGFSTRALAADTSRILPQPVRLLLAPVWVVAALHRARTRVPVPRIYLIAALTGAALGVILHIGLDVPWWLVTVGTLALVWLLFLASARRNLRNAGASFLQLTVPAFALRLSERRADDALRRTDLPLYGLPTSWTGPRFVGGRGSRDGEVTSWTLAHGDPYDEQSPEVRIEVSMPDHPFELTRRLLFEDFQHSVRRPPRGIAPDEFPAWVDRAHREIRNLPDPEWRTVTLMVEDRPVPFSHLSHEDHWIACAVLDGSVVVVRADRVALGGVALVRVTDVEPYLEGGRLLHEARHGPHDS